MSTLSVTPNTPEDLLRAVSADASAQEWNSFASLYVPVLKKYVRKAKLNFHNIQEADQDDIVQEAFIAIRSAMNGFHYDPSKGRFRAYLQRVIRNTIIRYQKAAGKRPALSPNTVQITSSPSLESDDELRLKIWTIALSRVLSSKKMSPNSKAIFRRLVIDEEPADAVAAEFKMKPNAVYQIKDRILRAVRKELCTYGLGQSDLVLIYESLCKEQNGSQGKPI